MILYVALCCGLVACCQLNSSDVMFDGTVGMLQAVQIIAAM
jgi:hypothetical protein